MANTVWLTNGSSTFEVPSGSPLEKRLVREGYEHCPDPTVEETATPTEETGPEGDEEAAPEGEVEPSAPAEEASVPAKKGKG